MDNSRPKPKKSKRKTSRQASPERLKLSSRSETPLQPEAGPSRLPEQPAAVPPIATTSKQFSSDLDFIALDEDENPRPKRPVREWDRGKTERERSRDRDRDRDRDRQPASRKRRWEENDRDGASMEAKDLRSKSRKAPWVADVDWDGCRNVAELLHKEVEAYLRYVSPTPIEHEVRYMTVLLIASSIKKTYPDAEVLPFGSFGTKLYLPQGDIDLVVNSVTLGYNEKLSALRSLANIVRRTGVTDQVTIISKARVPIIKFVTSYGRFSVDICMNQSNGVRTGDMINRFLDEFPALRALVLIIKSFLKQRNLNEVYSGGLGSYAIVCLAVSHLQVAVAYTVLKMHPKVRRAEIDSAKNLGVLLLEFFELYGKHFNYANTGISLRHGGSYFSKQARGWKDFYKPHLLCIEDPGDISNDISRGSFGIKSVKQTFAGAYDLMLSSIYLTADILAARQDGRIVDLRHGSSLARDPAEMSVLSSILGVEQATINHRRLVQEVYETGTLAHLLGIDPLTELNLSSQTVVEKRTKEIESVAAAWGEAESMSESAEETDAERGKVTLVRGKLNGEADRAQNNEEESRYDIEARQNGRDRGRQKSDHTQGQNGSARKRRRTVTTRSTHSVSTPTVFVPDEEDEEEDGEIDSRDEQLKFYNDPNPVDNSSDGLEEIERAYIEAADKFADSHTASDEDSAYAKGNKGKGKGKAGAQKSLNGELRRAYWAAKSMQGIDSDSS